MKIIITIIFILSINLTIGQSLFEVNGTVLDYTSKPIAQAHLSIVGTTLGTVTNKEGKFSLKIPQKYCASTLGISHISYATYTLPLDCKQNSRLKIILSEGAIQLDEVNITALTANQIMVNVIRSLNANFQVNHVNYSIFSRETKKKQNKPVMFTEYAFNLYHGNKTKPMFNNIKIRGKGFGKLGKKLFKEERLISLHKIERHMMLRYTPAFLRKKKTKNYTYRLIGERLVEDELYYILSISSSDFDGEMWVQKKSFGIAYLKETYFNANATDPNSPWEYETYYTQNGDKWFFKFATERYTVKLKKENIILQVEQQTVATKHSLSKVFDKSKKIALSVQMFKDFKSDFDDGYWDNQNYIPLDSLFRDALKKDFVK